MADEIVKAGHATFESIRRVNQHGQDFWSARELGRVLGYSEYRNFLPVIEKAKEACNKSHYTASDHFVEYHEMVDIGSGARREMASVALSRYACYLIVQNADPSIDQGRRQNINLIFSHILGRVHNQ